MKEESTKTILAARAPKVLVRKLDKAAKQAKRSRSAEMLVRLEDSFARLPSLPAGFAADKKVAA